MSIATAGRQRAAQSPLEIYLRDINATELLTADQEKELARRVQKGDAEARDWMVRANLRLVVNIARNYTNKGLAFQDLIEEGNLGLMRAVEGFDPTVGTRFSTYASYWIKQSIKRALINSAKTIRIPAYMVELLSKWRRAGNRLLDTLGRKGSNEEIARLLGVERRKLPMIRKAIKVYSSTPQTDHREDGWTLGDIVVDDRTETPENELIKADALQHIMNRLGEMEEREMMVLEMRYGLNGREPHTLKEIGNRLGLTRERVRQIEVEALGRLADDLKAPMERRFFDRTVA
ncbi:MAG: RNA polymerase subunit sigma [Rhodopirellula sp.]|nr:RNA polymerase subunit sigma [Rhodopirellula sp.]